MAPSAEQQAPPRSAWFPVFAPFVAWGVHFAVSMLVALTACRGSRADLATRLVVLGVGAAALAVALVSLLKARAALDQSDGQPGRRATTDTSVREFVAHLGLSSSVVFGVAILWTALPGVFIVRLCEVAR